MTFYYNPSQYGNTSGGVSLQYLQANYPTNSTVNTELAAKLNLSGGTLTGPLIGTIETLSGGLSANLVNSLSTSTAAPVTVILDATSTQTQIITGGAGTSTITLPDATLFSVGVTYYLTNNSLGNVVVADYNFNVITNVVPGASMQIYSLTNSTTSGTWDYHYICPKSCVYGAAGLDVTGRISASTTLDAPGIGSGASTIGNSACTLVGTLDARAQPNITTLAGVTSVNSVPFSSNIIGNTSTAIQCASIGNTTSNSVFCSSVAFPVVSGDNTNTLTNYEEKGFGTTFSMTFSGPWSANQTMNVTFIRVGRFVQMMIPALNASSNGSAAAIQLTGSTIPARFCPPATLGVTFIVPALNNNTVTTALVTIGTSGTIIIAPFNTSNIYAGTFIANSTPTGLLQQTYLSWAWGA